MCGNFKEVFVDFKELDQRMERSGRFSQASRDGRFQFILTKFFILCATEPPEIKASEVAAKQV